MECIGPEKSDAMSDKCNSENTGPESDVCVQCQISALDRVQNKAAKFAHHSGGSDWESLAQRRKTARMCALYKAYTGDRAWMAIGDRLQAPSYLGRVDRH